MKCTTSAEVPNRSTAEIDAKNYINRMHSRIRLWSLWV